MRIHIATDHAGFELKEKVVAHLREAGHDVVDHGAHVYDALDDYPPFCIEAAKAVVSEPGTSASLSVALATVSRWPPTAWKGCAPPVVWSDATARLAREHNDANMMAVGARQHSDDRGHRSHRCLP